MKTVPIRKSFFSNITDVCLITLDKSTGKLVSINAVYMERLKQRGINASDIYVEKSVSNMLDEELIGKKNVFIHVISGRTSFKDACDLMRILSDYDVNVVGVDFIECYVR